MTQSLYGYPICAVDFYTFEGGQFSLRSSSNGQQILNCNVTHTVNGDGGKFSIELPPGGPLGINSFPPWTTVLTPMSTVVISMSRANASNVVMVGMIESVSETQVWKPATSVDRTITVTGSDISIYFNRFNWMVLPFLQGNTLAITAGVAGNNFSAPFGVLTGLPNVVADTWLNRIMIGASGILGQTYFPYQGQNVYLREALYESLENYYTSDIPFGDSFMSEPISWAQKFREMLPYPFYETFWGTAPSGTWSSQNISPNGAVNTFTGIDFYSLALPNSVPARPQMISRILRFPDLVLNTSNSTSQNFSFSSATTTLWNSLNTYTLANSGYISSSIEFGLNNIKNFFKVNPTWMNQNFGNPANLAAFTAEYNGAADIASIHRYGYYPFVQSTRWFGDLLNNGSVSAQNSIASAAGKLITRQASYCEPLPLMANAKVSCELRPDIFAGNKFQYAPFRDINNRWQFYITDVTHSYRFGGPSTTTLTLSRGLPNYVYNDSNLLFNVLQGNAQRVNGIYQSGVPSGLGAPLTGYTLTNNSQKQLLAGIAKVYVTPQAK